MPKVAIDGLVSIDRTHLHGKLKAWYYQHGFLPHLLWPLKLYDIIVLHSADAAMYQVPVKDSIPKLETYKFPSLHWWRNSRFRRYAFTWWWGTWPMSSSVGYSQISKLAPNGRQWKAFKKQNPACEPIVGDYPNQSSLPGQHKQPVFLLNRVQRKNEIWWLKE